MASNILFILHLPPPVHGAAQVGQMILQSRRINEEFLCYFMNLATARAMDDLGKFNFLKIILTIRVLAQTFFLVLKTNPTLCYMTLSATGFAFYKDMMVVAILRLFRRNIVYHLHNQGIKKETMVHPWKERFFRFALQHKRAEVILLSPTLYYDISNYIEPEKVYFCANGVPDVTQPTEAAKPSQAPCRILFLSNLLNTKGFRLLLDACEELEKEGQQFECHFVGDWKDITQKEFHKLVQQKGLSHRVKAHGKLLNQDKYEQLRQADIFALPTLDDAFPLVLLEAMQHELPIISTYEGGIPDIVLDEQTGVLLAKEDVKGLTNKLLLLINNPELRQQMGTRGRLRYEKEFTMEAFENRLSAILKTSLKKIRERSLP
jgi:glycosyltransferase involved in cell wall biosynthesis